METNIVSIHFEHLLRNWVWATKIGLTFSQLAHGGTSTPRGRGVIQRCRLQRHPSMSTLFRRIVPDQRNLGNYDLIRSMSTLFRRVVAGQRDLGNYDLIRFMDNLFRRESPKGASPNSRRRGGLARRTYGTRVHSRASPTGANIGLNVEHRPRARIPYNRGCFLPSLPSPEG